MTQADIQPDQSVRMRPTHILCPDCMGLGNMCEKCDGSGSILVHVAETIGGPPADLQGLEVSRKPGLIRRLWRALRGR
jgi:hypothetical protein